APEQEAAAPPRPPSAPRPRHARAGAPSGVDAHAQAPRPGARAPRGRADRRAPPGRDRPGPQARVGRGGRAGQRYGDRAPHGGVRPLPRARHRHPDGRPAGAVRLRGQRRPGRGRLPHGGRPARPGARTARCGGARTAADPAVPGGLLGAVRRLRRAARRPPGRPRARRTGPPVGGAQVRARPRRTRPHLVPHHRDPGV
ncbi:MAG: FIG01269488: protein, clustered with ribosomal protein L32p, partial [uncultured Frankineae bacterium]